VVNPITGRREKVLKPGYYRDPFTGRIRKQNQMNYSTRPLTAEEQKIVGIVFIVGIAIWALWSAWNWFTENITVKMVLGVVLISFMSIAIIKKFISFKDLNKIFSNVFGGGYVDDEGLKNLIKEIEQMNPSKIRDEREFENQLLQWLRAKGFSVRSQVRLDSKNIIDLVVKDVGIELKLADNTTKVRNLVGQVTVYEKHFRKLLVVILSKNPSKIMDYVKLIKNVNPEKIFVKVIKHNYKRPKIKVDHIVVEKRTKRF